MKAIVLANHRLNLNGTTNGQHKSLSSEDFTRRLAKLAERWKSHHEAGLALRHETGVLLNLKYDDPTQRQPLGKKVMKGVATKLGVQESELSRMRRFAHHFKSVEDLRQRHPNVTTWTQVRELLTRLSKGGRRKKRSASAKSAARTRVVTKSLTNLIAAFRTLSKKLGDEERQRVLEGLQKFVKAVPNCLKVRLEIKQVRANPSQSA